MEEFVTVTNRQVAAFTSNGYYNWFFSQKIYLFCNIGDSKKKKRKLIYEAFYEFIFEWKICFNLILFLVVILHSHCTSLVNDIRQLKYLSQNSSSLTCTGEDFAMATRPYASHWISSLEIKCHFFFAVMNEKVGLFLS